MRTTMDLNRDWKFHLGEAEGASYQGYDDRAWRCVTLPHDWSVEGAFDQANSSGTGYLPGGVGWYRKHFTLPADAVEKRVFVTFDGVYQHSRVWMNSHYLGQRAYGYSSFTYELTGRVKSGENVLCVRAEHTQLADSRWFTGAGIYRDVRLTVTERAYLAQPFAYTKSVTDGQADIAAAVQLVGAEETQTAAVVFTLLNAEGHAVADAAGQTATLRVPDAHLWSTDDPYLYTLRCSLLLNGVETDQIHVPFGIRTIRFDPANGFFLNERSMKLKGVCIHHDAGALGAAVPERVWERRFLSYKAIGCNAIRFSHNPPNPKQLDLCDRLGLLAMDEAFDEWEGCKNKWWQGHNVYPPKRYGYSDDFPQWHERDMADLVLRDRNHPSVILWSIGNEVDYPNDPYVHPSFLFLTGNNDLNKPEAERMYDVNRPDASRLTVIAKELSGIVHSLDPSRPVTAALACPEVSNITGLSDVPDAAGYNYKEALYEKDHADYPSRVIYGSENGMEPEKWLTVKHNEYIAGQFLWTGSDFLGEARGWPVRISQAGLMDLAGYEKPLAALRRALWTEELCAKLASSKAGNPWQDGFRWDYQPGEEVCVTCYTNADTVALYLNGRPLGEKSVDETSVVQWRVTYEPGELRAVCSRDHQTESVVDSLYSSETPVRLDISADRDELPADGQSVAILEFALRDGNGRLVSGADEPVRLQLVGDAKLLGMENGDPADLTAYSAEARSLYHGRAVAYLRAGTMTGIVDVCAWTRSGFKAELRIRMKQS